MPTAGDVTLAKEQLARASQILCDTTDGAVKITKVNLGASQLSDTQADIIWYYENTNGGGALGSTDVPFGTDGNYVRIEGGQGGENAAKSIQGGVIAHELGHSLLGLWDGYDSQRRRGKARGWGKSVEDSELAPNWNSLMADSKGQVCHDSLVPNGTRCLDDFDCSGGAICEPSPPLTSELLTSTQYDTISGDGANAVLPGIRSGSMFSLQGWFSAEHSPDPGALSVDWSTFDEWSEFKDESEIGEKAREYVDEDGVLPGLYQVLKNDQYVGSSHKIRLYAHHVDQVAGTSDTWHLYAVMDQRERTNSFAQEPDPIPEIIPWGYDGGSHDYLPLVFDLSASPTYSREFSDGVTKRDADCFPVLTVGTETFDASTGESTGGPVGTRSTNRVVT